MNESKDSWLLNFRVRKQTNRLKASIRIVSQKYGGRITITERKPGKRKLCIAAASIAAAMLFCATAALGQDMPVPDGNLSSAQSASDMLFMLLQVQSGLQGSLNDLDSDLANASKDLSATGLDGDAARGVIAKLFDKNSNIVEAVTFNNDGKILLAECHGCSNDSRGAAVGDQDLLSALSKNLSSSSKEQIARVLETKAPDFSNEYRMAMGFNGAPLAYPVFSAQGELMGGVTAIIEPSKMMDSLAAGQALSGIYNKSNASDFSFWLMHLDGLIAYDKHPSEIGKNLFEDPIYEPYPSLLALGEKMIEARSGHGYYSFPTDEENRTVVVKETCWTTVALHGREWRLAATRIA